MAIAAIAPVTPIARVWGSDPGDRRAGTSVAPTVPAGDRASFEQALAGAGRSSYAADPAAAMSASFRGSQAGATASLGDRILATISGSPGAAAAAGTVRGGDGGTGLALARAQSRLARAQARLEGAQARLDEVQDALDDTGGHLEQTRDEMLAQAQARIEEAQAHLDEARASLGEARAGRRQGDPDAAGEADSGAVNGRRP